MSCFSLHKLRAHLKEVQVEAYCVKCKKKQEMTDAKEEVLKNGRKAMKGKCPACGTVMCRILGK